jgi:hypothetical protein
VGSTREISRLCETDPAFQWLTGMESINHHTLSDFRVDHREALDELFAQVLGLKTDHGAGPADRCALIAVLEVCGLLAWGCCSADAAPIFLAMTI